MERSKRYREKHGERIKARYKARFRSPERKFADAHRKATSVAKRKGYTPPEPFTLAQRDEMLAYPRRRES